MLRGQRVRNADDRAATVVLACGERVLAAFPPDGDALVCAEQRKTGSTRTPPADVLWTAGLSDVSSTASDTPEYGCHGGRRPVAVFLHEVRVVLHMSARSDVSLPARGARTSARRAMLSRRFVLLTRISDAQRCLTLTETPRRPGAACNSPCCLTP